MFHECNVYSVATLCPFLSVPHHGFIEVNSSMVGSEARYSCMEGYDLVFGDEIRTCRIDGTWSGVAPCCIRKSHKLYLKVND